MNNPPMKPRGEDGLSYSLHTEADRSIPGRRIDGSCRVGLCSYQQYDLLLLRRLPKSPVVWSSDSRRYSPDDSIHFATITMLSSFFGLFVCI